MKTIIAPTDFSPISLNAVNYAADLASVVDANLTLLHVCQIPITISEVPVPEYGITELIKNAERQISLLKDNITRRIGKKIAINYEVKLGNIVDEISSYCNATDVYAVVMGGESSGAFERILLGAKTISVIDDLVWPVLVVPIEAKFSGITKIGLACDLVDVAETVPDNDIRTLVKQFNAELHIINVVTEFDMKHSTMMKEESKVLQSMMRGLNARYHYLQGSNIEKEVMEFAERKKIDLLIVIPKKHTLISKLFQKSHTKKIVLQTHIPIMSIHE